MSHVLVLGRGWVGSAVAAAAADRGPVTVVDPPFDADLAARDAASTTALRSLIETAEITTVINACGRIAGTDDELDDANHQFVAWLCASLDGSGVRLVHVGSASEYGDPATSNPVQESTLARPVGTYATTKAAGTQVVLDAAGRGLDAVVARVFNIVGHPVPAVSPIHQWLGDLAALPADGGAIEVWWPPTTRDFVMIDDVAHALVDLALLELGQVELTRADLTAASSSTDVAGADRLVNVCSGTGLRFDQIVLALAAELGLEVSIDSAERPGIESVVGDPSRLRQLLGWVPTMSAEDLAARAVGRPGGRSGPSR